MRIKRLILLNQMAGPLFREVAEGLAVHFSEGCELLTGHPDTLAQSQNSSMGLRVLPAPGYDRRSMIRRLLSWLRYLACASPLIVGAKKTDAFLIVSNPPIMGCWFWLLSRLRKRSYIVLVYDIYPDVLVAMEVVGKNSPIVWIWNWLNRKVYRGSRAVVTLSDGMAKRLGRQIPVGSPNPQVIPPWADTGQIRPRPLNENPLKEEFNPDGKHVVLYSGNMGISHDIDSMLEAAELLCAREDILFLFFGTGDKWQYARDFADEHNLTNVHVHPFQPEDRLPYTMALSTVSLVALGDGAEELMMPSKVFYYLAAGSAVIGLSKGNNDLRDIIERNECGICIEPEQPKKLSDEITRTLDDKKRLDKFRENARRVAVQYYSKEAGLARFVSLLKDVGIISKCGKSLRYDIHAV